MARRATGKIVEHEGADGRTYWALRFTAYGKRRYVSLGAVTQLEAERELRHVLADVERGTWLPAPAALPPERPPVPTFHQFAEDWWTLHEGEWSPRTVSDYRWRLEYHLLPFFKALQLDEITFDTVERYVAAKLAAEKPLSPRSINMTVTLLGGILESALERELIGRNPARGRKRKVRERSPQRSYLDTAEHIAALLDAAGQLDRGARELPIRNGHQHLERRAMLAVLCFAGLRIGELCALRWRDVDLAGGWLHVAQAKTDAGSRRIKIRGALRDELDAARARRTHTTPDSLVFGTADGQQQNTSNIRARVLGAAVKRASANLIRLDRVPLPDRITPHSLRRTFASVLYALGEDPGVVMDEMGHAHPGLALRIYRQAMRRGEDEKAALRALIEGSHVAAEEVGASVA